jgi:hypothetical protein
MDYMHKWLIALVLGAVLSSSAWAQSAASVALDDQLSLADTVMVTVYPGSGKNQLQLDVFVVNSDSVAGMPMPFRVVAEGAKLNFDSVSYEGGRTGYFQLKTQNADTANQTVLLGLIADLSGSKPPLAPGRGKALTIFYTADRPINPEQVKVGPVILPPANKLEFNIFRDGTVIGVRPTFVLKASGAKAKPEPAENMGKGSSGKG